MSRRIKLVVFDCDGTLVDSQDMIHYAVAAAFIQHGRFAPDKEAVRQTVGLPLVAAMARLWPDATPEDCEAISTYYRKAFQDLRTSGEIHEPLFPGAREVLDQLHDDGYVLGIATGKSRVGLKATLHRHGILQHFRCLQTSDDAPGKPHPGMLQNAMAETGSVPAETVFIGDTTFDMEMARGAGIDGVGVSWGYHPRRELEEAGARMILHRFQDVFSMLEQLEQDQ